MGRKFGINQVPLSFKIDKDLLIDLDSLSKEIGCNRNRLINFAVKVMCENMLGFVEKSSIISVYQKVYTLL